MRCGWDGCGWCGEGWVVMGVVVGWMFGCVWGGGRGARGGDVHDRRPFVCTGKRWGWGGGVGGRAVGTGAIRCWADSHGSVQIIGDVLLAAGVFLFVSRTPPSLWPQVFFFVFL